MDWVEIKTEDILAHMPTDVKVRYADWLVANPDRAGRLDQLTANALREFRDNLASVKANIVDPRETWVPQSAVRHLETIVLFTLGMEMGLPLDSAAIGARYAADIFLRQILMGRYSVTTEEAGLPSPRFSIPAKTTSGRSLGILLALLVFAQSAYAGWIKPDSTTVDSSIATTFIPSAYAITTATLYAHLQGINAALAPLASTNYGLAAVAGIALSNTVDATARALATSASITANAALSSQSGYVPLSGGAVSGTLSISNTNNATGLVLGSGEVAPFINFPRISFRRYSSTHTLYASETGFLFTSLVNMGGNAITNAGTVTVSRVAFPAGDCLMGDGTNLFYVNAAKTITNNLTGNTP